MEATKAASSDRLGDGMTRTFNRVDSFVVGSFLVVAWACFSFGCGGGDRAGAPNRPTPMLVKRA
jgi:hypothetical protein